jgi:geranylgeranyl transferase type-2 subunit beta
MRRAVVAVWILVTISFSSQGKERPAEFKPSEVLEGARRFFQKTALPDGSFRPGLDPDYKGFSDTAYSDLAAVTYAVVLHKTFGWKLPDENKTVEFLLSRQKEDGAFVNGGGTADPKSSQARLYNTTQGIVALHALGKKPRYNPVPVLAAVLKEDYKKLPPYTTSFFPLAYLAYGQPFPREEDQKIRALMIQDGDGYVRDHVAHTFHLVHYYRLLGEAPPKAEAILRRVLRDQKADGSWQLHPPSWDVHAAFDAIFILRRLGRDRADCRKAIAKAAAWIARCRNSEGGFGHFPGYTSDADAIYFHLGALVMAGWLKPVDPLPKDPEFLSWGHLFPEDEAAPIRPEGVTKLFNGKDKSGLYSWLKGSGHKDPKKVFTVLDGLIHVSGEDLGYLAAEKEYRDYHLIVEYKWGEKTYGSKTVRNSGILLHAIGPDGGAGGTWMSCIECQLAQGCVGDLIPIRGKDKNDSIIPVTLTAETALGSDKRPRWKKGGAARVFTNRQLWWSLHDPDFKEAIDTRGKDDLESPLGDWTRVECLCNDKRITIKVNGTTINECYDVFPSAGKILLQSEGFEILFRRFELQPLNKR